MQSSSKTPSRDVQKFLADLNKQAPLLQGSPQIGNPAGTPLDASLKTIGNAMVKALPSQFPVYSPAKELKNKLSAWKKKLVGAF